MCIYSNIIQIESKKANKQAEKHILNHSNTDTQHLKPSNKKL